MSANWPDADDTREHFVYRLHSDADGLLYIGCTDNVDNRLNLHHVRGYDRVTSESYPTKAAARVVKRAAITAEAPLLNKQHNPTRFRKIPGGHFEPVEPIHPRTQRLADMDKPVTLDDMREAMEKVSRTAAEVIEILRACAVIEAAREEQDAAWETYAELVTA